MLDLDRPQTYEKSSKRHYDDYKTNIFLPVEELGRRGKKFIETNVAHETQETEWRAMCKTVTHQYSAYDFPQKKEGKKNLFQFPKIPKSKGQKVHSSVHLKLTDNIYNIEKEMGTKKRVPDDYKSNSNQHLDLKVMMGNKIRVETPRQRNFIGERIPGDKFYSNPEYSNNFFKEGHNSCLASYYFGSRPRHRNKLSAKEVLETKSLITFEEKERERLNAMEKSSVTELATWEKNTGLYTKAPKKAAHAASLLDDEVSLDLEVLHKDLNNEVNTGRSKASKMSKGSKK